MYGRQKRTPLLLWFMTSVNWFKLVHVLSLQIKIGDKLWFHLGKKKQMMKWGVATVCLRKKRSKFNSLFLSLYGFMIIDYLECQCGCRGLSYVGPTCLFNDTFKMSVNAGLLVSVLTFLVFVTSCTLPSESFTFNASY